MNCVVIAGISGFDGWNKMAAFTQLLYLSSLLGLVYNVSATKQQCGAELSALGMMLQRHIYKKTVAKIGHECLFVCRQENRCQSFNFVISEGICELNNRTKEARPEDYVPNSDRYYFRRDWKRGKFKIVKKKKKKKKLWQLLVNFPKRLEIFRNLCGYPSGSYGVEHETVNLVPRVRHSVPG